MIAFHIAILCESAPHNPLVANGGFVSSMRLPNPNFARRHKAVRPRLAPRPSAHKRPRYVMLCHSIELALKAYQRGEKRGGHQGWYLSRAESIRPRLVITIQPPPRRSIDFTVPAPGMSSPGATSIEPRGLSTTATPA